MWDLGVMGVKTGIGQGCRGSYSRCHGGGEGVDNAIVNKEAAQTMLVILSSKGTGSVQHCGAETLC